jgi:excisionase family DNA binding protein
MSDEQEALLDSEATAEVLGISVRGLYRLASSGQLPFHRVGRQMRFDRAELLAATRVPAAGRSA